MKFFFPDAHDYVDPEFDFERDSLGPDRERHRTDQYAHEVLGEPPFDGLLVSKSIVDGVEGKPGKYTVAQRHRLHRIGVHRFFRVEHLHGPNGEPYPIMGDCGAFSYLKEPEPPISVAEALEFYEDCGFTHAQSIDHLIPDYQPAWDESGLFESGPPAQVENRFSITLALAEQFIQEHRTRGCSFVPVGVAQGWSPQSYARAVTRLQDLGYEYIALGGLVPLKTEQFMSVVRGVMPCVRAGVKIHLLGVMRWDHIDELIQLGIWSYDSTSPLRQAFLDSKANYYVGETGRDAYAAVRVPQMDGNTKLKRLILAGQVDCEKVRRLESRCLSGVRAYDRDPESTSLEALLDDLDEYAAFLTRNPQYRSKNERALRDRPWRECDCRICREIGVETILFRGANRNRRRGFHNLHVAYRRLQAAVHRYSAKRKVG